jgi:hypothetical protein
MVILRATSILRGQKEDKGMMCSITPFFYLKIELYVLVKRGYLDSHRFLASKQVIKTPTLYFNLKIGLTPLILVFYKFFFNIFWVQKLWT